MAGQKGLLGAAMAFEDWPEPDRRTWTAALHSGGLFNDPGGGAHWRPATRSGCQAAYGRWLAFLARRGWLTLGQGPAQRLSRDRVVAYVEELKARLKPISVRSYISDINDVLFAMAP